MWSGTRIMITSAFLAASATEMTSKPSASAFARLLLPSCQPDDDVHAAIAQILGMRMTLAAIANDGDGLARERVKAGVLVVIKRGCHESSFSLPWSPIATLYPNSNGERWLPVCILANFNRPRPATPLARSIRPSRIWTVPPPRDIATGPVRTSSRMPTA